MPMMPKEFLAASNLSSSQPASASEVKRSRSLLSRVRTKKSGSVSTPVSADLRGTRSVDSSPAVGKDSPVAERGEWLATPPKTNGKDARGSAIPDIKLVHKASYSTSTAPPVSPLGLPEELPYASPVAAMPRTAKYDNLAWESATAAVLADSSSKGSDMSNLTRSGSSKDGDTSRETVAAPPALETRDSGYSYRQKNDEKENLRSSPEKEVSRKPSFAKRFFKSGKKRSS